MPPKPDPNEVKIIFVRAVGGEVPAASALAPKIGPMGLVCCNILFSIHENFLKQTFITEPQKDR